MPLDITIHLFQYFFKQFISGKIQDENDELSKSDFSINFPVNITTENGGFMKITDFNKSLLSAIKYNIPAKLKEIVKRIKYAITKPLHIQRAIRILMLNVDWTAVILPIFKI